MSRNITVRAAEHPRRTDGSKPEFGDILEVIADYRARPEYQENPAVGEKALRGLLAGVIKANNETELTAALAALQINLLNVPPPVAAIVKHFNAEFLKAYIVSCYPEKPILTSQARPGLFVAAANVVNTEESWFKDSKGRWTGYQQSNIAGFLINNNLAVEVNVTADILLTRADIERAALIGQNPTTSNALGEGVFEEIRAGRARLAVVQRVANEARVERVKAIALLSQGCLDKSIFPADDLAPLSRAIAAVEGLEGANSAVLESEALHTISDLMVETNRGSLGHIHTLGDLRELAVGLKEAVRQRNEEPAKTPEAAKKLQQELQAAVEKKKADTAAATTAILELCHKGQLNLSALKKFATGEIPANFVRTDGGEVLDEASRQLFLGAGNAQAAEELQSAIKDAFPTLTADHVVAPDPRKSLQELIETTFFDLVSETWKKTKPADKGVGAFLAADFNHMTASDEDKILALINGVDQHTTFADTAHQLPDTMTIEVLKNTAVVLQDQLKLMLQDKIGNSRNSRLNCMVESFCEIPPVFLSPMPIYA